MSPIIVLAGVGIISAFLVGYFLSLVAEIKRVDRRGLEIGQQGTASRLLLTVRRPADQEGEASK